MDECSWTNTANDPFLQQMMVSVGGEAPNYISYSVVRNPVQQVSAIVAVVGVCRLQRGPILRRRSR